MASTTQSPIAVSAQIVAATTATSPASQAAPEKVAKERANQICKSKIITMIAATTNKKDKEVKEVVDGLFKLIVDQVAAGHKVAIDEFGSWIVQDRKERNGVNPKTQEKIVIPAKRVATFTPSKFFKETVSPPTSTKIKTKTKAEVPPKKTASNDSGSTKDEDDDDDDEEETSTA